MRKIIITLLSLLLIISLVSADELNDCPGLTRTIEGSLFLTKDDTGSIVKPLSGVKLEIQSSCGNTYNNMITNSEGKFSAQVQGPVSVCISNGSAYFGVCHYLHNKNNLAGQMRVKEGKEITINVLNSQFNRYPKTINILQCSDGKTYTFTGLKIYLTKEMGVCSLVAHDNKKAYMGQIDIETVGNQIDIELNQKVNTIDLPSLQAPSGESSITMHKGWNLMPNSAFGGKLSTCLYNSERDNLFSYDFLTKEYIPSNLESYYEHYCDTNAVQCNNNKNQLVTELQFGSSWFYTPVSCQMISDSTHNDEADSSLLTTGWNFRYITKNMVGNSLEQISENCNIISAYYFDSVSQSWQNIDLNQPLGSFGKGFIVKVSNSCSLSSSSGGPPSFPS